MWKTFDIKTLGEYHDLYLKTDVLLLTDVFENFRSTCLEFYKLDPAHYFTSPGLSWDAMLKMTGINLQLMDDIDMYQFIEKGMRGGISFINHRYAKANNPKLPDYNKEKPESHIMYLDANNLYGWAMSQRLPIGDFKWVDKKEFDTLNLVEYKESRKGLIIECDIEYPKELHDLHKDYPLAPENIQITDEILSDYSKRIKDKYF